jgi:hypothetical protein
MLHATPNLTNKPEPSKAIYAQHTAVVEPVSGQIKGSRRLQRFRLWGLDKMSGE